MWNHKKTPISNWEKISFFLTNATLKIEIGAVHLMPFRSTQVQEKSGFQDVNKPKRYQNRLRKRNFQRCFLHFRHSVNPSERATKTTEDCHSILIVPQFPVNNPDKRDKRRHHPYGLMLWKGIKCSAFGHQMQHHPIVITQGFTAYRKVINMQWWSDYILMTTECPAFQCLFPMNTYINHCHTVSYDTSVIFQTSKS